VIAKALGGFNGGTDRGKSKDGQVSPSESCVQAPTDHLTKHRQPQAAIHERKAFLLGHLDVDAWGTDSEQLRHAELLWLARFAPLDEARRIARCRKQVEAKLRAAQQKRWRYERERQERRTADALKVERDRIVSALKSRLDGLVQAVGPNSQT
jgi:hypothetical protein